MIRWSIQKGFIPLPKSVNPGRQATNLDVFSFSLTAPQMAALDALEAYLTTGWDPVVDQPV
jgi:diketogulonate reductase-like aldo/keto reductase